MWIKIVILLVFVGIVASLASALFYLVQDKGKSDRSVRALTFRIGLSLGLFVFLMILASTGVITPHGLMPNQAPAQLTTGK